MRSVARVVALALCISACDSGPPTVDGGVDAGAADGGSADAGLRDAGASDGGVDTSNIVDIITRALPEAPAGIEGVTLIVHDASDQRRIEVTVGDFEPDRRVPIASASKLLTGLVLLRLIDDGTLSFSSTPRDVLGWSATPAADASLDHLGAFVSGMEPESLCLLDPSRTLQACATELGGTPVRHAPGAMFEYGSTHQAVAAAMAERATGVSWATLFEREIKAPLGLTDPGLRYYTLPKEALGDDNPLVAGGVHATPDEYMRMLAVLYHRGLMSAGGERLLREQTIARMGQNGYPDAALPNNLAGGDLRYSWSSWIYCPGAASPCETVLSPGAFGFTPWVDRDAGYYAVLAMESDGFNGTPFGVGLMVMLRQEIEAALQ